MATAERRYITRSWELMTRDKGWIKPLLVLGASLFVPIVGCLGVEGYGLEWARLTAWNVNASPKQKNVQVGTCIASGWRGFVSSLGYAVVLGLLTYLLGASSGRGNWQGLLVWILSALMGALMGIAALRAAIYQNFSAGYRIDRIVEMIRRDSNGFLRVIVATVLLSLGVGLLDLVVGALCVAPALSNVAVLFFGSWGGYGALDAFALEQLISSLATVVPTFLIFLYFVNIMVAWTELMCLTMWGLWMRQFDVAAWGASGDPLPKTSAR